jgi:divalent metal cation (Fe/Co/Zn/Cd) transporter
VYFALLYTSIVQRHVGRLPHDLLGAAVMRTGRKFRKNEEISFKKPQEKNSFGFSTLLPIIIITFHVLLVTKTETDKIGTALVIQQTSHHRVDSGLLFISIS